MTVGRADGGEPESDTKQLEEPSNRDRVVEAVRRRIVQGEFVPGQRITEWEIANALGVSRGPVREGLRELAREGLVLSLRNRGAMVMDMSEEELTGLLLPVRLTIERYAALVAKDRLTSDQCEQLEGIVADMELAAGAQDTDRVTDLDLEFHRLFVEASDQQHALHLWDSIFPRIQAQLHRIGRGRRASLADIPGEHRILISALSSRDPDQIAATLEAHIVGDVLRYDRTRAAAANSDHSGA